MVCRCQTSSIRRVSRPITGAMNRSRRPNTSRAAIAVAIVGTPLALSIRIPVGTMVSGVIGRRAAFLVLIGLSPLLALIGCVIFLNRKAGFA